MEYAMKFKEGLKLFKLWAYKIDTLNDNEMLKKCKSQDLNG